MSKEKGILEIVTGVHCGCCGKWIPDQTGYEGWKWGLCLSCARGDDMDDPLPTNPKRGKL